MYPFDIFGLFSVSESQWDSLFSLRKTSHDIYGCFWDTCSYFETKKKKKKKKQGEAPLDSWLTYNLGSFEFKQNSL